MSTIQQPHETSEPEKNQEVTPLQENRELVFGANKLAKNTEIDSKLKTDNLKSNEFENGMKKQKNKKKKKELEEPEIPLREQFESQGLFDQITGDKQPTEKIRELDNKLAKLDQLKKELYE